MNSRKFFAGIKFCKQTMKGKLFRYQFPHIDQNSLNSETLEPQIFIFNKIDIFKLLF